MAAETQRKFILGDAVVAALLELGIADTKTRRVVIDATVGEAVIVTLEKFGDDRLLSLAHDGGIRVTTEPAEAIAR